MTVKAFFASAGDAPFGENLSQCQRTAERTEKMNAGKNNGDELTEREEKVEVFKFAYRLYYLLDMPASLAFSAFCNVMRTSDYDRITEYLYSCGLSDRDGIHESIRHSTVKWREDVEDKYKYIKDRMRDVCFRRLSK